jgi:hypothetical protein
VNVVDLHPEDLLEKDAAGELDATERARLDAHVERCVACRLEQKLRADFSAELAIELPGEAFGLVAQEAVRHQEAARESRISLSAQSDGASPSTRRSIMRPRRRRARAVWLFAAAVLLVGGVAAAMGLRDGDWPRLMRGDPAVVPAPAEVPTAEPVHPKVHHVASPLPVLPEPTAEASSDTPEPIAPPMPPVHVGAQHLAPAAGLPLNGPAELLDAESRARRRGEYGTALDVHKDLEARYPTSREAQVSREIVGRLLLDRGDPVGALANFDSYLAAGSGDLRQEAMVGRATALDRLGRGDEAARGWADLLTAFPDTPYAPHARERSESLNGH